MQALPPTDQINTSVPTTEPPVHPLERALRRQQRVILIGCLIGAAAIVAAAAVAHFWFGPMLSGIIGWLIAIAVMLVGVPAAMMVMVTRQGRKLIAAHAQSDDGLVCPWCAIVLAAPPARAPQRCSCPKCARSYAVGDVREYWQLTQDDPPAAARLWLERLHSEGAQRGWAARLLRIHDSILATILFNAALWLGAGVVFAMMRGVSLVAGAFTFAHMFLIMTGFMIMTKGWRRRLGSAAHCAACGYQKAPTGAAAQCPECGAAWNLVGGVKRGEVRRSPARLIGGALLLVLGFASILSPVMRGGWQLQVLPTSSLIHEITQAPRGFTVDEWAELRTRTLAPAQERRLAEGLLAKRLRKGYFSADADNWLVGQIAAGALPRELTARYYAESLEVWIEAPARARAGDMITLAIGTRYRHASTNNPQPVVYVGGFTIGGDRTRLAQQEQAIHGIMLGERRLHTGDRDAGPGTSPKTAFAGEIEGPLRVQLEVWIVHLPPPSAAAIAWQPDGSPVIPAAAAWVEHRVVEHEITIDDDDRT